MPDIFKTYNCSLLPFNFTVTKEGIVTLGAKEGMDTIIRGLKERHYIGALMPHFRGLPYDLPPWTLIFMDTILYRRMLIFLFQ